VTLDWRSGREARAEIRRAVPELAEGQPKSRLARRLRGEPRQLPSGRCRGSARGYYDPPPGAGFTLVVGPSPEKMLALEWADTVRRPRKLTHDPRRARPDAVNLPRMSEQSLRHGISGQTPRWSAGRRAGPVMAGHLRPFRRWALPRGGPRVRPDYAHQRLPALHLPSLLSGR
jgi:hypothetical protein